MSFLRTFFAVSDFSYICRSFVNAIFNLMLSSICKILSGGYGANVLNLMRFMGQLEQGILDANQTEFPLTGKYEANRSFSHINVKLHCSLCFINVIGFYQDWIITCTHCQVFVE